MLLEVFNPTGTTVNIAVTAASQNLTLPVQNKGGQNNYRLVNAGSQTVFFKKGADGASLTTSIPVLAGSVECFEMEPGVTTIAVIAAAVGSTLYVTAGKGA